MFDGYRALALISVFTGVIALLVGIYVLQQGPRNSQIRMIFMASLFFFIGGVFDFLMNTASDRETAIFLGKLDIFTVLMVYGLFFYLALLQLPNTVKERITRYRFVIVLTIISIALLFGSMIDDAQLDRYGWGVPFNFGLSISIMAIAAYAYATIVVLVFSRLLSDDNFHRRRVILMAFAMVMPFLYSFSIEGIEFVSDIQLPRLIAPGFTLMIFVMAYAVIRYRLFIDVPSIIENVKKSLQGSGPVHSVVVGKTYLVEEKKPDYSYKMFLHELGNDSHGLIVTREHPDNVRGRYGIQKVPIIWLTFQPGPERIDPANISILQHTITEFLDQSDRPIILLDGIDHLQSNNRQEKVLQLLSFIRDEIIVSSGKMILSVDPQTMDEKILAFLERDLEVVKAECPAILTSNHLR